MVARLAPLASLKGEEAYKLETNGVEESPTPLKKNHNQYPLKKRDKIGKWTLLSHVGGRERVAPLFS